MTLPPTVWIPLLLSCRHLGAGLTFALARLLVLLVGAALHFTGAMDMRVKDNKLAAFYVCSYSAAAACIGCCEVLARQLGKRGPRPAAPGVQGAHVQ
jgi:hypothetical protein